MEGENRPKTKVQRQRNGKPYVLGIRVSEKLLVEVKTEAARRRMTVSALFEELWSRYKGDQS